MEQEIRNLASFLGETTARTLSLETAVRTFRREVRNTTGVGDAVRRGLVLPAKLAIKMTTQQVAPMLMTYGEEATDLKEKFGEQGWQSSDFKAMINDAPASIISPGYIISAFKIGAFVLSPLAFMAVNFLINGVTVATKKPQENPVSSSQLQ